ncbi:hypothetical protein [Desulfonema magnum]|uniref:RiboL-PSP-HEPN domain-containing protein n=1 Tax=Desulfonema magnum TaxID=45655 RepID=A0A975GQU0_9BACT|nr:hypothetical protein [Desulfonema magnum]QTA90254.1 Uncharacterized protein dnm_063150 [Desulfonema magnum]
MSFETPLDRIWESYQVMCDCLKIAQRGVVEKNMRLLNKTGFWSSSEEEARMQIKKGRSDANDYVILSLWAAFERIITEYLLIQGRKILDSPPTEFNQKVYRKIEHEMEYWKPDDILNMFKSVIDSSLIGQAKQIKQYRDWVAHRNISKGAPANVPPKKAYEILSEILYRLENHPDVDTN